VLLTGPDARLAVTWCDPAHSIRDPPGTPSLHKAVIGLLLSLKSGVRCLHSRPDSLRLAACTFLCTFLCNCNLLGTAEGFGRLGC
jgi:hypothetical protein